MSGAFSASCLLAMSGAFSPPSLSPDGVASGLECSGTATLLLCLMLAGGLVPSLPRSLSLSHRGGRGGVVEATRGRRRGRQSVVPSASSLDLVRARAAAWGEERDADRRAGRGGGWEGSLDLVRVRAATRGEERDTGRRGRRVGRGRRATMRGERRRRPRY